MNTQHIETNAHHPDLPHIEPLSVDYSVVVIDVKYPDYTLQGKPVSPYFHTIEEARAFHAECKIDEAYCISGAWFPANEEEAEALRIELFKGEKPQPAVLNQSVRQRVQEEIAAILAERALA
jgi:hypothetical protein